jgi:hypothetical protein
VSGYNTIGFKDFRHWKDGVFKVSPFLSRSALDYLRVRNLIGANRFKGLVPIGEAGGVPISLNPTAAPLWFCAGKVYEAGKPEEDWELLNAKREPLTSSVFVDHAPWLGISSERTVWARREGPDFCELETGPGARALLVSSEAAASGWTVRVDGQKRSPVLVNHAFRGVELLPGDRQVRWDYAPDSLRLGLFVALLALGIWMASITAAFRNAPPR